MKIGIRLLTTVGLMVWALARAENWPLPGEPAGPTKIPLDAKRWYQVVNAQTGLDGLFDGILDVSVNTGWGKPAHQLRRLLPAVTRRADDNQPD